MPTFLLRQPDDKIAAFSTVVEDFTAYDMTTEEALLYCIDDLRVGRDTAETMLRQALEDHIPFKDGALGDGTQRWAYALKMAALNHTRAHVAETLTTMGFPDIDISTLDFAAEDDGGAMLFS